MNTLYIILFTIHFTSKNCFGAVESKLSHFSNKTGIISRESRALAFPGSSTLGILLALAIPLGLPNQEVFLSYNFEANYNSPASPDFGNLGLAGVEKYGYPDGRSKHGDDSDTSTTTTNKSKKRQKKVKSKKISRIRRFVDRNIVFNVIENKLISYGFSKTCLLRAICEVASNEYGYNNGVFGDIFHLIFTPTSSKDDDIDLKYYIAEYNGNSGECGTYHTGCPKSILDFFTVERYLCYKYGCGVYCHLDE